MHVLCYNVLKNELRKIAANAGEEALLSDRSLHSEIFKHLKFTAIELTDTISCSCVAKGEFSNKRRNAFIYDIKYIKSVAFRL
jgi:hypothetical protein